MSQADDGMHSVSADAPGLQRRCIRCSLTTAYTIRCATESICSRPTRPHLFVRQLQRLDTFKESRIRARDLYGRLGARHRHPELSFHLLPEHAALAPALTHCVRAWRAASTFFPDGFFVSALKKLLGAAHTRCEQSWLLDSESVPFRPFAFRAAFDDFWAQPTVYYIPGASCRRTARSSRITTTIVRFGSATRPRLELGQRMAA